MVIFGVEVSNSKELDNFIYKSNKRFKKVLLFYGELSKVKNILVVNMRPLLMPFYWMGLFSFFVITYFWGFNKFSIMALMVFSGGIVWTRYFFYFFLKMGLKKEGHKGKIKLLYDQNTLREVLYGSIRNNWLFEARAGFPAK